MVADEVHMGERRKSERVDIELPVVLTRDDVVGQRHFEFRAPGQSVNLGPSGVFVACTYQLKAGTVVTVTIDIGGGERFSAQASVTHGVPLGSSVATPGLGFVFIEVDPVNRERILRFFVSDRIRDYYHSKFLAEFPHLEERLSLKDVALVVNLWEEHRQAEA